jgi:dTDP-4-dehydrorhamnose reductase
MKGQSIVVLGGTGMLGHKIFQVLREQFPGTICTTSKSPDDPVLSRVEALRSDDVVWRLNAMNFTDVENFLRRLRPGFIVCCVGIIKQRIEAKSPIPSITINSLLPHRISELAREWGGHLIHFSTDCVFSGHRGGYTEEDGSDAEDLYGRTKYLGEVSAPNATTLRTSIIGRELLHHHSLLDWFLAQNHKTIRGFRRVIYSGVTTNHLAAIVADLIRNHSRLSGLYQVASEPITKYDLLCLLRKTYNMDVEIVADDREISDRSMSCVKFNRLTGYICPSWPALAEQLANDPTPYDRWLNGLEWNVQTL